MSNKYYNCKIINHTNRKISIWSSDNTNNTLLPDLIKDNKYNPSKNIIKEEIPSIDKAYVKIPLTIDKKNTWIFYWASIDINEPQKIMGNYNYGLVQTNRDGECILKLNCPKNYKTNKLVFPNIVNYTYLTSDNIWNPNINILNIMCYVKYKKFSKLLNNKEAMILYSNDIENKELIPNSFSITNKKLVEMDIDHKDDFINKFILDHIKYYPKLDKILKDNKISIEDIHIIVYGNNNKDETTDELIKTLLSLNFSNILKYMGGLEEWNKMKDMKEEEKELDIDDETIIIEYEGIKYKMYIDSSEIINDDNEIIGILNKSNNKIKWLGDNEKKHLDNPDRDVNNNDDNMDEKYKVKLKVIKNDDENNIHEDIKKENIDIDISDESDLGDISDDTDESDSESESNSESESDNELHIKSLNSEVHDKDENNDKNKDIIEETESDYKLLSEIIKKDKPKKKKTFKKKNKKYEGFTFF